MVIPFSPSTYQSRRTALKKQFKSGILFFPGNGESPLNYAANWYFYRQDSSFLYYWALDMAGLSAIIDIDNDREIIFGDDLEIDDVVWSGPQPTIAELAGKADVSQTAPAADLAKMLNAAQQQGRQIHFLPQYRAENKINIAAMLDDNPATLNKSASLPLIKAVVAQRSVKTAEEVAEIEKALEISYVMHTSAMKLARPGMVEHEVAGEMEGIALKMGGRLCFPGIFSIHGETLHNHHHFNRMKAGDIVVNDCGSEAPSHYCSDITRTIPIGGKFSPRQRDLYQAVLDAQMAAIDAVRPGIPFRDVHLLAARIMTERLQDIGLMKGNLDDSVSQGAHGIFFPHGLGHMMGLDVHDMEALGENHVGYDDAVKRSEQFGTAYLRMGKALQPGYVLTVEPGCYMIPTLIDMWKADKKFSEFINYDEFEKYKDFGGIRIEDDVLVTEDGYRVLGKAIPKTVTEVEELTVDG